MREVPTIGEGLSPAPRAGRKARHARAAPAGRRFSLPRAAGVLSFLLATLVLTFLAAARWGAESIDPWRAFAVPDSLDAQILFGLRLPRLTLALVTGMGLGAAGAAYQGLLRNPLADPFVLGVSGGAALGGSLALVLAGLLPFAAGGAWVTSWAFGGAVLATLLAYGAGRRRGQLDPNRTLLFGVVFNSFAAALITLLKTATTPDRAQELLFWLTGTIGYERPRTLLLAALAMGLAVALLATRGHGLNLIGLGDEGAASLGVEVGRLRATVFLAASAAVAVAVSLTGLVAFVGLVVPHIARLCFGPDQRLLVPASALGGAIFLLGADLAARLLFAALGTELPVGALTALAGGPFFLFLLYREKGSLSRTT